MNRSACSRIPADDAGRAVAHRRHGDPRAEVDQRVAVHVDEHAAAGGADEHREDMADPAGHGGLAAGQQLARARSGDLGDEAAHLGQARAALQRRLHGHTGDDKPRSPRCGQPSLAKYCGPADSPWPPASGLDQPASGRVQAGRRDGGHGRERVPGPVPQRHPGQRDPGWHGQRQVAAAGHGDRADPLARPVGQGGHRGRGPGIDQPGVGDDAGLGREHHGVQRGRGRRQPEGHAGRAAGVGAPAAERGPGEALTGRPQGHRDPPAGGAQPARPGRAGRRHGRRGAGVFPDPRHQAQAGGGCRLPAGITRALEQAGRRGLLGHRGQLAAGVRADLGHPGGWVGEPGQVHLPATRVHGHGMEAQPGSVAENRGEAGHGGRDLQGRITGARPARHVVEEGDVRQARGGRGGRREQVPVRAVEHDRGQAAGSVPGEVAHGQLPGGPVRHARREHASAWRCGRVQDPRRRL